MWGSRLLEVSKDEIENISNRVEPKTKTEETLTLVSRAFICNYGRHADSASKTNDNKTRNIHCNKIIIIFLVLGALFKKLRKDNTRNEAKIRRRELTLSFRHAIGYDRRFETGNGPRTRS